MQRFKWFYIFTFVFIVVGCSKAGTFNLLIKYQPLKEIPSFRERIGPSLGIVPIKDERPDTLYIGRHTTLTGFIHYFKSQPFPFEKALADSLLQSLSSFGIKTVMLSDWDGKPDSLKKIETDSILRVEIKRFWIEGRALSFRTQVVVRAQFVIHLGIKREGKVYTKNMEMEKEFYLPRLTPQRMEQTANQVLSEIFDHFFSHPN